MGFGLVAAVLSWAAPQSQQPKFHADANFVVLQVTVTATSGRRVPDLKAEDFVVFEDGRPQPIQIFSQAREPLALSLMLDASQSMDESIGLAQDAAIQFSRKLRPDDRAEVLAFNNRVQVLQPFSPYSADLETAIRQTAVGGTTALYNALYVALRDFEATRPPPGQIRRHAIVLLSDGEDTSSLIPFDEVFDLARRSDVSIYTIGLGLKPSIDPHMPSPGAYILKQFATTTGGRAIFVDKAEDLLPVYGQVADELATQYTIAYTPPVAHRDGKWHTIAVRVNRENCTARTRTGYLASDDSVVSRVR
jgi:Ca-activated chloride channel family protein